MKKLFLLTSLLVIGLSACSLTDSLTNNSPNPQVIIVVAQATKPPACQITAGQTMSISLLGVMPKNARVKWRVFGGGEIKDPASITTVYTAPNPSNGVIELRATITNANGQETDVMQQCSVVAEAATLTGPAIAINPEPSATPAPAITPSYTPTSPAAATPTTPPVPAAPGMVAITEIMANPCGNQGEDEANEYIELFNYSDRPVDLSEVYLMASNQEQNDLPDQLVAWQKRNSVPKEFNNVITDSTFLQPRNYALILEPNYHLIKSPHKMPYNIPAGTLILTMAKKNRLGNEVGGLISGGNGRDSIYLFTGTPTRVEQIITTYAIRYAGPYPYSIIVPDQLPLETGKCQSVHRVTVPGEDKSVNWTTGPETPGAGTY